MRREVSGWEPVGRFFIRKQEQKRNVEATFIRPRVVLFVQHSVATPHFFDERERKISTFLIAYMFFIRIKYAKTCA